MEDEIKQEAFKPLYSHFVGVRFRSSGKSYFFATNNKDLMINDPVIVETTRGVELGFIAILPHEIAKYKSTLDLKPILREAIKSDLNQYNSNEEKAKDAFKVCAEEIKSLNLQMHLISSEYTLDGSKVIISYSADQRVDFRELLKSLAGRLHCRIELRQVGPRDKSKIIGGLGICGLPLCCSNFLNEFDGISINRAKNKMLALNIPKLSGQCGKLICCLKFEDDAYTDLKKDFPNIGDRFTYKDVNYRISSYNVISNTIKIESEDDIQFLPL